VLATSAARLMATPRRASSVARYWARAASFSRRIRPHRSSSHEKPTVAVKALIVTPSGLTMGLARPACTPTS